MKDIHPDILSLLVQRATEGLSDEQQKTLAALLEAEGLEDTLELDLAAAAATNAFALRNAHESEQAPAHLKARLQADANAFFDKAADNVVAFENKRSFSDWGWAAAAMLAVALLVTNIVDFDARLAPEQAREALLADADGTAVIPWSPPDDSNYAAVEGNVVWNDERQQGYLLLANMPVNDPSVSQYQLWVVDPDRDKNPVDGGVFDIPPGAESVVVPIDVKLGVSNPIIFAITREQPGGVVVSEGPLLVVASAS